MAARTAMTTAGLGAALIFLGGCVHGTQPGGDRAATTEVTSTEVTSTELISTEPMAVAGPETKEAAACSGLHDSVQFAPSSETLTRQERRDIGRWASCLKRPEMEHQIVVVTGGANPEADGRLFQRRADAVRALLAQHGVDPGRVVTGAPNATRAGGRMGPCDELWLELSGASLLRAMR